LDDLSAMQTVTMPEVQNSLPELAQAVLNGECFIIPFQGKAMMLHLAENTYPPLMREPGYFDDSHDEESIALENLASSHSPQHLVP
jgi:hypothetical protein